MWEKLIQRIRINISTGDPREILNAIQVDNVDLPEGMSIEMKETGEGVEVVVEMKYSDPKSILTLRNTVDEILEHVEMLMNILKNDSKL
ncbi:hypothetical protein L3N51_02023 [Metallosphaera sp. J1]|nr:hypothetical protein [Metallosphaera javensis (ex Hofmann et al. 2022)]